MTFINKSNLITSSQYGFMQKKSTVTQVLSCLNDWSYIIDKGEVISVVYLDLAKAFDKVSHKKLISGLMEKEFVRKLFHGFKIT